MARRFNYQYKRPVKGRFLIVFFFFIIFFIILIARLFFLQIIGHRDYVRANENRLVMVVLPPKRGFIFDRNLKELAMNVPKYSLYAVPRYISKKEYTTEYIATVLNRDKQEILEKISNDKMFVWIARKLSESDVQKIKSQRLLGIDFIPENERSYPNSSLAAHVLGFVDIDNNGLEGIEKYYDRELRGASGYKVAMVDAMRRQVSFLEDRCLPPRDGYNVILTIDEVIQHIAEKAILAGVERYKPKSASVVVMDPSNGDILALCNWPTYDLNYYANASAEEKRNRAITDIIEPGSSFKIVTANGVLEEQICELTDKFDCENGTYRIFDRVLHDHRPHGVLTFKDVIRVSSNIGTVKIAQKLGNERLYKYIKLFGFGEETGIDLPGEVKGIVRYVSAWSKGSISAIPIGQEVAATTVQLAVAISCIANDGILVRPRLVKKLIDSKGILIKEFEPKFVRRAVSKDTSLKMKEILNEVVENGTGRRASVPGYSVAGKTGTAQRIEADGSYSHSKFNSIFIGFAPIDKPRLAVAVVFVEPSPYYYGGTVAAPVFSEIADKTLRYMGIPADMPASLLAKGSFDAEN